VAAKADSVKVSVTTMTATGEGAVTLPTLTGVEGLLNEGDVVRWR